jgi:hypothetical protein
VYRFVSASHRDAFLANSNVTSQPTAAGSYDARGDKVQVDPKSFIVSDGRLFLFYKGLLGDTRAKWLKGDAATEAATADAMWKKVSGESARSAAAVTSPP